MKVFISWSGDRSKAVATALRTWIPDVIQSAEPWMSKADIDAGSRWGRDIEGELAKTRFGVLCLTPENVDAAWLLFEAGALAKTIEDTYVCPYLFGMEPGDVPPGPLTLFQAKRANRDETWDVIQTINKASGDEEALTDSQLERAYKRWWPALLELPPGCRHGS